MVVIAAILSGDLSRRPMIPFAGLAALVLLLRTTPPDAVKLRRWTSNLLIFAVAILLMPWRWSAIWLPAATVALLLWLRVTRRSSWWAVVFAWNPAAVTAGWWCAAAVVLPVLALTGLSASAGFSKWIVLAALLIDLVWFGRSRVMM